MPALTPPHRPPLHRHWQLDPEFTYLNHGSFGACPTAILQVQQDLQQRLERQPMNFLARDLEPLWDQSRQRLAEFLGALPENLVFVPNATTGVNTVLRSLVFQPGQEILTTDHAYNASRNARDYVAERSGAKVVVAAVPFPLTSVAEMVEPILAAVTPQTALVLLDHVSSQTGLIFPLETLIPTLTQQGIPTLIDGAHAAGMLPLQLEKLGATYYSGNCHKWLCAPKGAGFLYVQPQQQHQIRPLTISHGANSPRTDRSRFWLEFDWVGTDDPSPYLCVAQAIDWLAHRIPGGWAAIQRHNHDLVVKARQLICDQLGLKLPCPEIFLGSLASLILPDAPDCSLADQLWRDFKIEVPVFAWPAPPHRILRISANLYNHEADYLYLAAALEKLLEARPTVEIPF
jgi:isopenicillin-N epimerase